MTKVFLKPGSTDVALHRDADAALMLAENVDKWPARVVLEMLYRNKTPLRLCLLALRLEQEEQTAVPREFYS